MIEIKDLHVNVETPEGPQEILKGLNLTIEPGKVHAVMGPNGSGKSTLSYVLSGREGYEITQGSITMNGTDIIDLEPEERAALGMFLAFQYPVEIPGVTMNTFLKSSINGVRKQRGQDELDSLELLKRIKEKCAQLGISNDMMKRSVNEGFSGGEKKRNEVLQMAMLEPEFCIMDETDSGLDIDALKIVAQGINTMRDDKRSFLVITHYQRLLDYITPDIVHVLAHGQIVKTGGAELAKELEQEGYNQYIQTEQAA